MLDKFFQMGIKDNGSQEEQNVYVIKSFIDDIFNNHDLSAVKLYSLLNSLPRERLG